MGKLVKLVETTLQELNKGHAFEGLEVGDKIHVTRKNMNATVTKISHVSLKVEFENGKSGSLTPVASFEKIK